MHEGQELQRAGLAEDLVEALNLRGVEYCHWKSNWALASGLSGEADLDLFVDRRSLPSALGVLANLGFRPAAVGQGPRTPGTSHHYGLDPESGRILHVHLYTMIITGESYLKSHRFPFETMLLENRTSIGSLKVVSKPAELVLHIVRTFTKYGSLVDAMRLRQKPDRVTQELRWLQTDGDTSEALSLLRKHCPVVDEALFLRCIDALHGRSLARRVMLGRAVRARLRIYARHKRLPRLLAYLQMYWFRARGRLTGIRRNQTPQSGGAVLAFVGGDGVGKSTLVLETSRWLARAFTVRTIHAGKPPPSWLTAAARSAWRTFRRLLPLGRSTRPADGSPNGGSTGEVSLREAIKAVTLARDRRRLLVRARRHSANGDIVICDRYPSDTIGAMDSPCLRENPTGKGLKAALHNRLARIERRLYSQIPPPDVVVRLTVPFETARQRNLSRPKPDRHDYLEARHREGGWIRSGTMYLYDIDTDGPLEETVLRVKKALWQSL